MNSFQAIFLRFQALNVIRGKEYFLIEKEIEEKGSLEENC